MDLSNFSAEAIDSIKRRLKANSRLDQTTGCIIWTGAKVLDRGGYGRMMIGSAKDGTRKDVRTHRLSFALANGPIPDGLLVCHKCDVPACVNADHMFLGTPSDNAHDCLEKGRYQWGEINGNRKLTRSQALEIATTSESATRIARRFGVSKYTVHRIRRGATWVRITQQAS